MKKTITDDGTLQVDINEATLALKENRFSDALTILEINLSKYPDHIDLIDIWKISK